MTVAAELIVAVIETERRINGLIVFREQAGLEENALLCCQEPDDVIRMGWGGPSSRHRPTDSRVTTSNILTCWFPQTKATAQRTHHMLLTSIRTSPSNVSFIPFFCQNDTLKELNWHKIYSGWLISAVTSDSSFPNFTGTKTSCDPAADSQANPSVSSLNLIVCFPSLSLTVPLQASCGVKRSADQLTEVNLYLC